MEQLIPGKFNKNPVVLIKYRNRKLYNSNSSRYSSYEEVLTMINKEVEFIVFDYCSKKDITTWTIFQAVAMSNRFFIQSNDNDKLKHIIKSLISKSGEQHEQI